MEHVAPVSGRSKMPLPACGLYLGSGVYNHTGRLVITGQAFTYWSPDYPTAAETVDLCVGAAQGNTLQFWQGGEELLALAKAAVARGLYVTCIYSSAPDEVAAQFRQFGDRYLGYDFGERFSMSVTHKDALSSKPPAEVTLKDLADNLMRKVSGHVAERKAKGWGPVMATSADFYLDYEVAAGTDIPVCEDYAFRHLLVSSALSRGLYRQYDLPLWGAHLAHEWYSWIPHTNPLKMPLFRMGLYLKYMSGAKLIINESGNWALQSSLCPDSPMHTMPRVITDPPGIYGATPERSRQHIDDARRLFCNIDYRSPVAAKYRREIADFYAYVQAHPAPAGQPEATVAIAKGNYDICYMEYTPGKAVAGAYPQAEINHDWYEGDPERCWDIVKSVFYPRPPVLRPNKNHHLSGTPYGLVDIVSFADDRMDADFLIRNYQTLIFGGWNTCSEQQYETLVRYVGAGGRLCISLPHLSCNRVRNYRDYTVGELVNGGDFSALCGLKVVARGDRFYWATGNTSTPNAMGLACPRRYGIMATPLATLDYTREPSCYEALAVDDEASRPVILRCRQGLGEVFFINGWYYPSMLNADDGPGCVEGSKGLMGLLYGYLASLSRGHVWITGPDFAHPDEDCEHIACSYFPDAGRICLLNIDFRQPRRCVLHQFGDKDFIELAPGEFRLVDSVVLKPGEKHNQE